MSRTQYQFIPTDPDSIVEWMAAKYEELTGVTVQPGSPERLFIQWAAAVVIQERALANYAANQNLPSRAEGKTWTRWRSCSTPRSGQAQRRRPAPCVSRSPASWILRC